jgi:hypothetical protein
VDGVANFFYDIFTLNIKLWYGPTKKKIVSLVEWHMEATSSSQSSLLTTRSGRLSKPSKRTREEFNARNFLVSLT